MRVLCLTLAVLAIGCGDDKPPAAVAPPVAGDDAGVDAVDAGTAPADAGGDDAGTPERSDAGSSVDTGAPAPPDGSPFDDGGDVEFDPCVGMPGGACTAGSCPAGTTCLTDGCGGTSCMPVGASCATDADCPSTSTCIPGDLGRVCSSATAGCVDSRECPLGFACEAGSCRDRRIRCGPSEECPRGFYCESGVYPSHPFCLHINKPCSASGDGCFGFGACVDVDGDGARQCSFAGPACTTNADCTAPGHVCGVLPTWLTPSCVTFGPCAHDTDCAPGHSCLDTWGDGTRECVESGGSCRSSSECPGTAVCGSPALGGPPRCIDRPLP